jgi:chitinase
MNIQSIKKPVTFFTMRKILSELARLLCLIILFSFYSCSNTDEEVKNKLPEISSISPSTEELVKDVDIITLKAAVSDADGSIIKVEFLINGAVVGEDINSPYEFDWAPATSNAYNFTVKATDNAGGVTQLSTTFTAVGFSCKEQSTCTYEQKSFSNVVMAFYPSWKVAEMPINSIPFSKITHIIYSFALPLASGEINTTDVDSNIDALVAAAHSQGVKVYFSIGGGSGSDPFIDLSLKATTRALFADRVKCYVKDHCLDGVDIDWEHWNGTDNIIPAESNGLVNLLADLRSTLDESTEISVDVAATNWGGKHYLDAIVPNVNYVNAMLYDLRGPWSEAGPHSAYNEVITDGTTNYTINSWGLMYWAYRQWPAAKIVVGIPFYGRDFDVNKGEGVDYKTIVTRVTAADGDINADKIGNAYYDGPVTVAKKAAYARDNGYAGVMFWELSGDTNDNATSLVEAIDKELN